MTQTTFHRLRDRLATGAWSLGSLAAFLIGTGMRWYGLSRFPFEQDELYTLQESRELFATTLRPGIDARPLYYLLHHVLAPLLPAGEFGARLPAFLFGLAGLVVTWKLGRYLGGAAGGFLAIALCAFSPWHLFVSGEARYWSLIYLVSVGTLLLLLVGRAENSWGAFAGAGMLILVGTLTHPTFVFPFVGIGISVVLMLGHRGLLLKWPNRRELIGTWLPAGVLILGYMLSLKLGGRGSTLSNWSGRGWAATLRLVPAMVQLATPVLVAGAVLGVANSIAWGTIRAKDVALTVFSGVTFGTILLLLASTRTDVYADYGVSMLPLGIAAVVLLVCEGGLKAGRLAVGITGVLLAGMLPASVSQLSDGMRFDYRPAYSAIASQQQFARPVLAWPLIVQRYYAPTLPATEFMRTTQQLDSLASTGQSFWVVASENRGGLVGDNGGAVQAWLDNNCRRRLITQRTRLDYRQYRVVSHECNVR